MNKSTQKNKKDPIKFCPNCQNHLKKINENGNKYLFCKYCSYKEYSCYETKKSVNMDGRKIEFYCVSVPDFPYDLWNHQKLALQKWKECNRKGIAEMATATGKTLLGIAVKKLDEGIDIKDAEILLNVDYHNNMLQLIQRTGRIVRKCGNKSPLFIHYVVPIEEQSIRLIDKMNEIIALDNKLDEKNEEIDSDKDNRLIDSNNTNITETDKVKNQIDIRAPHGNLKNKNEDVNSSIKEQSKKQKNYICPACSKKYTDLKELTIHFNIRKQKRCDE